jgi:hypothetical protein
MMQRNLLKILMTGLMVGFCAMALRRQLIEPDAIGRLCTADGAPEWCILRQWLVMGFVRNAYGYLSVAAVLLAVIARWRIAAWLGLAAGIVGCILYRFDPAGAGVLLSALVLARLGLTSGGQRRAGQQTT